MDRICPMIELNLFKNKGNDMTPIVITYILYVIASVALTVWVARTLALNGLPFITEALKGDEDLARSVNHLLVVGFYLINLGYAALSLKLGYQVVNTQQVIEALFSKLGLVVVVLGGMHFFNLYVLNRLRTYPQREAKRTARREPAPPPIIATDGPDWPTKL